MATLATLTCSARSVTGSRLVKQVLSSGADLSDTCISRVPINSTAHAVVSAVTTSLTAWLCHKFKIKI